jgi:hypothetical protein
MSTRPKLADFDGAGDDLEEALNAIDGIAAILGALEGDLFRKSTGTTPKIALDYLADRLRERRAEAVDAFCRVYGMGEYSPQRAAEAEKEGAA